PRRDGHRSTARVSALVQRIAQPRDFVLYPGLDLPDQPLHVVAYRTDRRTDRHGHRARPLAKHALRPQIAGIMRHRNDRDAKRDRQACAAALVVRARPGPDSRAFRVDDDPESLAQALASLRDKLTHRIVSRLPIDRYRGRQGERPAEEWNRQQL